jgi:hypothetical protein
MANFTVLLLLLPEVFPQTRITVDMVAVSLHWNCDLLLLADGTTGIVQNLICERIQSMKQIREKYTYLAQFVLAAWVRLDNRRLDGCKSQRLSVS